MEAEFYYHTKNRLLERYQLDINPEEYENLCRDLLRLRVPILFSKNAGGHRSEIHIEYKGQVVRLIWDKKTRNIVTVLPREGNDDSNSE